MEKTFNLIDPDTKEIDRKFGKFISDDDLATLTKIGNTEYEETASGFVNYCNDLLKRVQVICKIIHNLKFVHKWNDAPIRHTKILCGYDDVNNGEGIFATSIKPYIAKSYDAKKSVIDELIKSGEVISDVIDIDRTIDDFIDALDEMISAQFCADFVVSGDGAKYLLCKISSFFNVSINDNSDKTADAIIENIKITTLHSNTFFDDVAATRNMGLFVDCAIARCNYANYMKEVAGAKFSESPLIEIEPGHMSKIYPVIKKKTRNKLIKKVNHLIDGEKIMKSFCKNINSAVESAVTTDVGDKSYIGFIEKAVKCIRKINLVDVSDIERCDDNCTCKTSMDETSESDMVKDVTPCEHRVTGVFKSNDYLSIKELVDALVSRLNYTGEIYDADDFVYDAIDDIGAVCIQFIFRDRNEDESERRIYETDTYTYITDDTGNDDFEKVINKIADEFIINDEDVSHTITEEIRMMQSHGPIEISVVLSTVGVKIIHEDEYEDDDEDGQDFISEFDTFKRKKNFTFEELMKRFVKCSEGREDSDQTKEFIRKGEAKTGAVVGTIEFKGDSGDSYEYKFCITHDEDCEPIVTIHDIIDFIIDSGKESGDAEKLTSIISRIQNHGNITVTMTFFAPAGTYAEVLGDDTDED